MKLTANTVVLDENRQPVVLLEGDDVPGWAADQVGEHLTGGTAEAEKKPTPPPPEPSRRTSKS